MGGVRRDRDRLVGDLVLYCFYYVSRYKIRIIIILEYDLLRVIIIYVIQHYIPLTILRVTLIYMVIVHILITRFLAIIKENVRENV